MDFETIVRRAGGFDRAQPHETPDAVIDVHDEIAGGEARHLGDEIFRTPRNPPRAHQAVAQDVLLRNDRRLGGLESAFESEHRQRDLRLGQPHRFRPRSDLREIGKPVVGEHVAHALARAFAPQRDDDALAAGLQGRDVRGHRLEHVAAGFGSLGGKIMPLPRPDIDDRSLPFRHGERREPRQRGGLEPPAPLRFAEIEPIGRQRHVERARPPLAEGCLPRVVVILDLIQPLARRLLGERLDHHGGAGQIVEQRVEPVMEQRKPMLHAGMAPAFAHGMVEKVVGRGRAERFDIAETETPDRFGRQLEFRHRHQIERPQLIGRALAFRIEAADRLKRVAEKIEPDRLGHAGRVEIDNSSAHGIIAGLAHGRGAHEAIEFKPLGDAVHGEHIAGHDRKRLLGDKVARRHALERGIDRREQHGGAIATLRAHEARERRHPLGDENRVRRDAVVGQAVPGRKLLDREIGREKTQRPRERGHARAVAAHHDDARRRRAGARRNSAGEIGRDEALGAVGDACQGQRATWNEELGGTARHAYLAGSCR